MKTYCNPLSIPDIPAGRFLDMELVHGNPNDYADYRSISDPGVIFEDGKWYLFPSYDVCWVSEDYVHWKHIKLGLPNLGYSPAVVKFRGNFYLNGYCQSELYVADNPLGPYKLCGHLTGHDGKEMKPADGCFLADGDRLYMYWCGMIPNDGRDIEANMANFGVELNPDRPWEFLHEPVIINCYDENQKWQRYGEHNQDTRMGWVEGPWAYKRGSRYYLLFAACGTEFSAYANGVVYSDDGPLYGFKPQPGGALTEKRTGIVRGAGHGCIVDGPNNTLWTFYTNIFCYNFKYERRISMDPVGIDNNGFLFCNETTETPQLGPGETDHPEIGNGTGWLPLTFLQWPKASSAAPGRDAIYASDDSFLSWWQPEESDKEPCITFRLDYASRYELHALRLIWRDIGMETRIGRNPGPFQYVAEYAPDSDFSVWKTLVDAAYNPEDLCIDYRELHGERAYGVRLRILGAPVGITPGLVSLTVFGNCVRES